MKIYAVSLVIIFMSLSSTKAKPTSLYYVRNFDQVVPVSYRSLLTGLRPIQRCIENNILTICRGNIQDLHTHNRFVSKGDQDNSNINLSEKLSNPRIPRLYDANPAYVSHKILNKLISIGRSVKNIYPKLDKHIMNNLPTPVESSFEIADTAKMVAKSFQTLQNSSKNAETFKNPFQDTGIVENTLSKKVLLSAMTTLGNIETTTDKYFENNNESLIFALGQFERGFYRTNFNKFLTITPASKGDSGISFVQSGLFLAMTLLALSTEADLDAKNEIDQNFGLTVSNSVDENLLSLKNKVNLIKQVMSSLPNSSEELKFRWSSRLVLRSGRQISQEFKTGTAEALQLNIGHFEDGQTPVAMAQFLNSMIEEDSDGAIRDTFDEDDITKDEEAVLITTLYFRARWRSAPTLLNGTWLFRDTGTAPPRTIRMIRINDIMKYVDLPEWDAEAIEIPYLTQGLSLLMLVPRGNSLRRLVEYVSGSNLTSVTKRMHNTRIAVSLPLFTLRMTLLLPSKLQAMGISRLVDAANSEGNSLRISQAVQRIMFWAEAGRNAYKDDGLEWDTPPDMNIVVDRPYMFCVQWQNLSLMLGNFVL